MQTRRSVQKLLQSRSFLLRILACVLLIGCIPLLYSSLSISNIALHSLTTEMQQNAKTSATSMTREVDEMLANFETIAHLYAENADTYLFTEGNQAFSAGNLQQYLRNIQTSLPVLVLTGLYYPSARQVYSSAGLLQITQICRKYFPGLSTDAFFTAMQNTVAPTLMSTQGDYLAYLVPAFIQPSSPNRRIAVFVLSSAELNKALSLYLPTSFHWAGLYDREGQLVYRTQDVPASLTETATGAPETTGDADVLYVKGDGDSRYTILIAASEDEYRQKVRVFSEAMQRSTFLLVLVSILLAGSVVWITYRPVQRMLRSIPPDIQNDYGIQGEFATIQQYIDDQQKMQQELRREAQEQRQLNQNRIFEKLLYGIRISPEAESTVRQERVKTFCVAAARLNGIPSVRPIIEQCKGRDDLLLLELYDTGHLALILFFENAPRELTPERQQELRAMLPCPVAFGPLCTRLDQLHESYIRAAAQLGDAQSLPASPQNTELETLHNTLLLSLKGEPDTAKQTVDQLFACLEAQYPSMLFRQYAFADYLQRFQAAVRLRYPQVHFTFTPRSGQWKIADMQAQFQSDVQNAVQTIREQTQKEHAHLIDFVDAHLSDPYFGLNEIAQHCNVTEYTASRIFKETAGQSFKKYITAKRIARAKELLRQTDRRIVDIAEACGFASASYFARIFRSLEDVTPADYRQENRS